MWGLLTVSVARCLCRVHDRLIYSLYGEDAIKLGMKVGHERHDGGPSQSAAVVVVRLVLSETAEQEDTAKVRT